MLIVILPPHRFACVLSGRLCWHLVFDSLREESPSLLLLRVSSLVPAMAPGCADLECVLAGLGAVILWLICRSHIVACMPVPMNVLLVMTCAWKALL